MVPGRVNSISGRGGRTIANNSNPPFQATTDFAEIIRVLSTSSHVLLEKEGRNLNFFSLSIGYKNENSIIIKSALSHSRMRLRCLLQGLSSVPRHKCPYSMSKIQSRNYKFGICQINFLETRRFSNLPLGNE